MSWIYTGTIAQSVELLFICGQKVKGSNSDFYVCTFGFSIRQCMTSQTAYNILYIFFGIYCIQNKNRCSKTLLNSFYNQNNDDLKKLRFSKKTSSTYKCQLWEWDALYETFWRNSDFKFSLLVKTHQLVILIFFLIIKPNLVYELFLNSKKNIYEKKQPFRFY